MSHINVYIITDGKNGNRVSRLLHIFHDDLYEVMEAVVPSLNNSSKEELNEIYQVQWCLEQSRNAYPNRPVLVIRDNSITHISREKLKKLMLDIKNNDSEYDMFYLCRWNDHCQKHIDIKTYCDDVNVGRTYAANGTQAIYFSVSGRDILLGREVMKNDRYLKFSKSVDRKIAKKLNDGHIVAYCTLHNIFEFDLTQATRNIDFNKLSPCSAMIVNVKRNNNNTSNLGYFWFVIIVILIIILAFAIARVSK